jgi:hypothetical protein
MKNWRSNLSKFLVLAAALLLWAGQPLANPEAADARDGSDVPRLRAT